MSKFDIAYARTTVFEGNYSNDPEDKGKETYKGISRVNFPSWVGWSIIDSARTIVGFPKSLETNQLLQDLVYQFYKATFWNKIQGDSISDQNIANEVYDCAVNMGISRATTFLQQALNVLNKNATLYLDIVVDGSFGLGTLKTLNGYLSVDKSMILLKVLWILRGNFYLQIMLKDSTQERFARGWLNRITVT